MGVSRYALGKLSGWKHVLTQVQHGDVAVMRMFGKNVQHRLVVITLRHQIVHDQDSSAWKPRVQLLFGGYARTKGDTFPLQLLKTPLPRSVTIMHATGWRGKQITILGQETYSEHRLARSRGTHDQDTGRGTKGKRCALQHDALNVMTMCLQLHSFIL